MVTNGFGGKLLFAKLDKLRSQSDLAWFRSRRSVVEVIEGLDLQAFIGSYRGSGSASYHPEMLLGVLVYGYGGVFEPEAGAGDVRFGGVSLHRGE